MYYQMSLRVAVMTSTTLVNT